ncbi:hypothetical protein [Planctomicrobium sp. SH664]|uniref:hypothetical protein n=1 Tax=Planctomicrobium sp. SH664 TaxID=3448125 RepID=UPI003F5CAF0A
MKSSSHSSSGPWRRPASLLCLMGIALLMVSGCQSWFPWKKCEPTAPPAECGPLLDANQPIPRSVSVLDRSTVGIPGERTFFTQELVAALNQVPYCQAILLPPNFPLPGAPYAGAPQPEECPQASEIPVGTDEIWIVQVTEIQPFRPIRVCATIERRQSYDGLLIERIQRTWDAPIDDEPLAPSHFNARILRKPPPRGIVEHHELSRLSPRTYIRNITQELAIELMAPLPPAK